MKFKPFFFLSILVLLPLFLLPRIFFGKKAAPEEAYEASDFILGTFVKIKVYEPPLETLFEDIFEEIREYEALLSPSIFTSDVSRLNRAAGLVPVKVDPLVISVLKEGLDYSKDSEGPLRHHRGPLWSIYGGSATTMPGCPLGRRLPKRCC